MTVKNKTTRNVDFETVAREFSRDPMVKRGRMFSSENVLSVNGKIFAMLNKDKFVVKLPENRAMELVKKGAATNWAPGTRRPMKEWVSINPEKMSWTTIAREAYHYVKG
jgi:TfoX/Sxy family transcriptional regulator of competence genes